MKEIGKGMIYVLLAMWAVVTLFALPAFGAESERIAGEEFSAARTAQLEWIALAVSSAWALILQIFRLNK